MRLDILIYLKHFPASGKPVIGGTAKAVDGLATGLARCGARVTVLCEGPSDTSVRSAAGYQIRCFTVAWPNKAFSVSKSLRAWLDAPAQRDCVVILNGMFNRSVLRLAAHLKRRGRGYIVAPHDPYHPDIFAKNPHVKWPYWWLFEKPMLRGARAVQILDSRHAQYLEALGIRTPTVVAPNGFLDSEVLDEQALRWEEHGTTRLLFLGRLDMHNKGLDILLESMASLGAGADCHLTIQGPDWGDRRKLTAQATRIGVEARVTFRDPDYTKSSAELVAPCDIFCLPSRYEGFGLSALEAMLASRVLLVSRVAGIAPHIEKSGCGVVVDPDARAVADGLKSLFRQRASWKNMGAGGRDYALRHLRWESIARSVMPEYARAFPARQPSC